MRILVVDDEEDVQYLFKQEFRKEIRAKSYSFSFALNAAEALQFLDRLEPFDVFLVLSDINMPGMTGLEMVKKIKERRTDLIVIMVTAYGDKENYETSIRNGAADLVTKPVDFVKLRELLHSYKPTVS